MRRTSPIVAALALFSLLSACGDSGSPSTTGAVTTATAATTMSTPTATPAESTIDPETPSPAAPKATATTKAPVAKPASKASPLTCKQLRGARLGSKKVPFNGYPDFIPLFEGVWSGEDGATVELQKPCAVGDLDGDGAADAVGTVMLTSGGSGKFWTVVVWRNSGGKPVYRTLTDLGDRTPVISVSATGGKATVVWLTRSDDKSMAELDIKRTSVYKLSGTTLTEVTHTDAPYTP